MCQIRATGVNDVVELGDHGARHSARKITAETPITVSLGRTDRSIGDVHYLFPVQPHDQAAINRMEHDPVDQVMHLIERQWRPITHRILAGVFSSGRDGEFTAPGSAESNRRGPSETGANMQLPMNTCAPQLGHARGIRPLMVAK